MANETETKAVEQSLDAGRVGDAADRAEFKNLMGLLQKGKVFTKEQRARLRTLAAKLGGNGVGVFDYDFVSAAELVGVWGKVEKEDGEDGRAFNGKKVKHERAMRIAMMEQWQRWGWSRARILSEGGRRWGMSQETLDEYFRAAVVRKKERLERSLDGMDGQLLDQFNEAYSMAREAGNPALMIQATQAAATMLGVNRVQANRLEISGPGGRPVAYLDVPRKGGGEKKKVGQPVIDV